MQTDKKLKIFIVEDNLLYQQLIARQLESISSAIHFYTKGEDCITELTKHNPDMVVLDNNLEGMMSGLDTLKIIRDLNPALYVVIFSTQQALDSDENLSLYGPFDFVEKTEAAFEHLKETVCSSSLFLQTQQ